MARPLRDIGSRDITLGFGSGTGAISTISTKLIFTSLDDVGEMVVGRVKVAVSIYAMVPRSNCVTRSANKKRNSEVSASYVYAARQPF